MYLKHTLTAFLIQFVTQHGPASMVTANDVVNAAKSEIEDLISRNSVLPPKFVRLGFHDCVGGCDGCVDMENQDNAGLDIPIDALDPIVSKYANDLSRADIWALAALTGAERASRNFEFPMNWIGRQNCEDTQSICSDANGQEVPCDTKQGPHRDLPPPDMTTSQLLHFFSSGFGLSPQETVALMGAHSIGTASRINSGFDGPSGWDSNPDRLNNQYYAGLIGGDSINDFDAIYLDAPGWTQVEINNRNNANVNRFQWNRGGNNNNNEQPQIMLNADIALVRDISSHLNTETGEVSCHFRRQTRDQPRCPYAAQTIELMAAYKFDDDLFMNDFRNVFNKVLVKGYDASATCNVIPCTLESDLFTSAPSSNTPTAEKSSSPTNSPVTGSKTPSKSPVTGSSTPSKSPVTGSSTPSKSPVTSSCEEEDGNTFFFKLKLKKGKEVAIKKTCKWLKKAKSKDSVCSNTETHKNLQLASVACPKTCGLCTPSNEFLLKLRKENDELIPTTKTCAWLQKKNLSKQETVCAKEKSFGGFEPASKICSELCSSL